MNVREEARAMKLAAPRMAASTMEQRNAALTKIMEVLEEKKNDIYRANDADVDAAKASGVPQPVIKRLRFNEGKLKDCVSGLKQLIELPDPVGKVTLRRELDEGLLLERVSVPIGVIGVIFEARPDALIQISSLCIKSGNCAILKGGKETTNTNKILFELIRDAAKGAGLPEGCLLQVTAHNEIDELLGCQGDVDLLIPRGSNKFVQYIMDNTNIPVMGHSSGVCHIYVDGMADLQKAIPIIVDAKTQYPAACNAVETILVKRSIAAKFLPMLDDALYRAGVKVYGTEEVTGYMEAEQIGDDDFGIEYSDLKLSVKLVSDVSEAVDHINCYGSHHTDAIITEDDEAAAYFEQMVDSAGVYRNCSTRFADGFRYGFGAEVGISTGKLHARGPVGLEGLVTYKYRLTGNGQIVGDYAEGRKEFHHKDL